MYFISPRRIDYFVVIDNRNERDLIIAESPLLLKEEEKRLFARLEEDC